MTYPLLYPGEPNIVAARGPAEETIHVLHDISSGGMVAYSSNDSSFALGVISVPAGGVVYHHFSREEYQNVSAVWLHGERWMVVAKVAGEATWEVWISTNDLASVQYARPLSHPYLNELGQTAPLVKVKGTPAAVVIPIGSYLDITSNEGLSFTQVDFDSCSPPWLKYWSLREIYHSQELYWILAHHSGRNQNGMFVSANLTGPYEPILTDDSGALWIRPPGCPTLPIGTHIWYFRGGGLANHLAGLVFLGNTLESSMDVPYWDQVFSEQKLLSLKVTSSGLIRNEATVPQHLNWGHLSVWGANDVLVAQAQDRLLIRGVICPDNDPNCSETSPLITWREVFLPRRQYKCGTESYSRFIVAGDYAFATRSSPAPMWAFYEGLLWRGVLPDVIELPPLLEEEDKNIVRVGGCTSMEEMGIPSPGGWIGDWFQEGNGIIVTGPAHRGASTGDLIYILNPDTREVVYSRMPTTGEVAYNRAFCGWIEDRWLVAAQKYDASNSSSCSSSWDCGEWELWESFDNLATMELIGPSPCPVYQIYSIQDKVVLLTRKDASVDSPFLWHSIDKGRTFTSVRYCPDGVVAALQPGQATNIVWAHNRVWVKVNAGGYSSELRLFSSRDWEVFEEFNFRDTGPMLEPVVFWGQTTALTVVEGNPTIPVSAGCNPMGGRYLSILSSTTYRQIKFPVAGPLAELVQVRKWGTTYVALEVDWEPWPPVGWIHMSWDLEQWYRVAQVERADFSALVFRNHHLVVQNNPESSLCFFVNEDIAPYLVEGNCWVGEDGAGHAVWVEGEDALFDWTPGGGFGCTVWDGGGTYWDGGNTSWDCMDGTWAEEDSLMCTQLVEWSGDN